MREIISINQLQTSEELISAFPLIAQLRPQIIMADFINIYHQSHKANQYMLFALKKNDMICSLIGLRVMFDLVHGKHIYIDDLITDQKHRSNNYGSILLNHAEKLASSMDCHKLRLCTGIENSCAKKFYEKNGWKNKAIVFKKYLT